MKNRLQLLATWASQGSSKHGTWFPSMAASKRASGHPKLSPLSSYLGSGIHHFCLLEVSQWGQATSNKWRLHSFIRVGVFRGHQHTHLTNTFQEPAHWLNPAAKCFHKQSFMKQSHAHVFIYCVWLLLHFTCSIEWLQQKPYDQQSLKVCVVQAFTEKVFWVSLKKKFLFMPHGMWDSHSSTRDWTHTTCNGSTES